MGAVITRLSDFQLAQKDILLRFICYKLGSLVASTPVAHLG